MLLTKSEKRGTGWGPYCMPRCISNQAEKLAWLKISLQEKYNFKRTMSFILNRHFTPYNIHVVQIYVSFSSLTTLPLYFSLF